MNKKIRAGALVLALAAALSAASFATVLAVRGEAETAAAAAVEEAAALKQGSRGEDVKTVQRKLKRWGYYDGNVDGIYGPATKKAVTYFQRKNGLTADGIVGSKTFAALGMMQQASGGSRGELYRAGRRRRGRAQPRKERPVPQHHFGRHLPAARLHGGFRRADQPHARPDGDQRRERRDERLGSDVRLPLLLQPRHRHERVDLFARNGRDHRQARLCHIRRERE